MRPRSLDVRRGLPTGEVELVDGAVIGIAVHTAARLLAEAGPDEAWSARTVKDLVAGCRSRFRFADRGTCTLKGVAGDWPLFAAEAQGISPP